MLDIVYKAVCVRRGHVYSLGMGKAKPIELSAYRAVDGGKFGISAAKTEAGARAVIGYVLARKKKPIPKGKLMVVRACGMKILFQNRWRVVYRALMLWDNPVPDGLDLPKKGE